MDLVLAACEYPLRYPLNLAIPSEILLDLDRYNARIYGQTHTLFSDFKASQNPMHVHEFSRITKDWKTSKVASEDELRKHLKIDGQDTREHNMHRLYFFETQRPTTPLSTTHEVLALALSFHQVIPTFLDSLLEYGPHCPQLLAAPMVFRIPFASSPGPRSARLGRSGTRIESSYTIRCPQYCLPGVFGWDIGSATIYSSFDMYYGTSTWFIFSSDEDLKNAFIANTNDLECNEPSDLLEFTNSYERQLEFHLDVLEWARRKWKDYYKDVETCMQELADGNCTQRCEQSCSYRRYVSSKLNSLVNILQPLETVLIADSAIWKEFLVKQRSTIAAWRREPVNDRRYRPASEYQDEFSSALDDFEVEMLDLLGKIEKSFQRFRSKLNSLHDTVNSRTTNTEIYEREYEWAFVQQQWNNSEYCNW